MFVKLINQLLDTGGRSGDNSLNPTIGQIADESGHGKAGGDPGCRPAKPHTLNVS